MKYLLLVIFLFAFKSITLAQTPKIDTISYKKWNGSAWQNDSRQIFTYNVNCQIATILYQQWDAALQTWSNSTLTTNTYETGNNIRETLIQIWNIGGGKWDNYSRSTYTYDISFKVLSFVLEYWATSAWEIFFRSTYAYDLNGYYNSILTESAIFGSIQNSSLTIFDNNSNGTADTVINQNWNSVTASWDNGSRYSYAYNADKTISQTRTEFWNTATSNWENMSQTTYTYNTSGKILTALGEMWGNNLWINDTYTTNTYGSSGFLINEFHQKWDTGTSSWDNISQNNYARNGDGTVNQVISQNWDVGSSTWKDESLGMYSYTTSCTLPLHLLSFTASRDNNIVSLSWETTNEINTSHFTVQRSVDGINFSNLGNVAAKNNSQTNNYGFTDNVEKISGDKVYYRLQMMDKDGKFSYSKTIPLTLELFAGKIKVYPNPVKDQLYILFNMQNATKAELRITDAAGKTIYRQRLPTAQNNNAASVNVSALPKGVYYVQVITDNGVQKTQFVKQ